METGREIGVAPVRYFGNGSMCLQPEAYLGTDSPQTTLVHGVMAFKEKSVRQNVTLPAKVATQVRSMAKRRRLSANRMLVELVEEGIVAKKEKEKAFFELAFGPRRTPKKSNGWAKNSGRWFSVGRCPGLNNGRTSLKSYGSIWYNGWLIEALRSRT